MEFFKNPNADTQSSAKAEKVKPDRLLRSLTKFYETGRVKMEGTRTVAELETDFWESFGLSVQVFRQSGNLWIETTLTDHWTLDNQNHEAEFLREKQEKSLEKRIEDDPIDPT